MRLLESRRAPVAIGITLLAGAMGCASPAVACEPIIPLIQVLMPITTLSGRTGSGAILLVVVILKSILFAAFEKRLPRLRAVVFMFAGNILTSFIGMIAAAMIGSGAALVVGVPVVLALCWPPSRRLVATAPRPWFARRSAAGIAMLMTLGMVASCLLFMAARDAIGERLALYWVLKFAAIYLALIASIALTTVWEEWAVWRLASRPEGMHFYKTVLRANIYVLLVIMTIAAAFMLPKRLKSPDFLARLRPPGAAFAMSDRHDVRPCVAARLFEVELLGVADK